MVCPFCLHKKTSVTNSRRGARLNEVWRRRHCNNCGAQFTTREIADIGSVLAVVNGKTVVPFSHTNLLFELLRVCSHRQDQEQSVPYLACTIEQKLCHKAAKSKKSAITHDMIFEITSETLKNYDPAAYIAYIALHKKIDAPSIRRALTRKK